MKKIFILSVLFYSLNGFSADAKEEPALICKDKKATGLLKHGFDLQKDHNTEEAFSKYLKCLELEPSCVSCLYEIGWNYWKKGEWNKVIYTWEAALKIETQHPRILEFLPTAKENLKIVESKQKVEVFHNKTSMLIHSQPADGPVTMTFVGRWQSYNSQSKDNLDHFDQDIDSPKSVVFSPSGDKVYVNSLEGGKTIVFNPTGIKKLGVISHRFKGDETYFEKKPSFDYKFPEQIKNPNSFLGKPVESLVTHGGKYLWVTYYRRSFDEDSRYASAMALIDTQSNQILRVFSTGPIAKYVQSSPDESLLAVSNWGDNTVSLYDISGKNPSDFKPLINLVVEEKLKPSQMKGNRDKNCGFCLRGLAFSHDSRYLFVTRMKKGGIAMFDLQNHNKTKYLGTVFGIQPGSRDIQISANGEFLYIGCNASGYISKVSTQSMIDLMKNKNGSKENYPLTDPSYKKIFAGLGVRSLKLTHDGKYLFAAVNQGSELQVYDAIEMKKMARIEVDSFPVGLALSPDGTLAWVTSQGRSHKGGNSVGIFQIQYKLNENISTSKDPRKIAN